MATKFFGADDFLITDKDDTELIIQGYEWDSFRFVSQDDCHIVVNGTPLYWGAGMIFNATDFKGDINSFVIKNKGIAYHFVGSYNV